MLADHFLDSHELYFCFSGDTDGRFLSLLGLTGRRLDPVTHSKISATWTRNLVAGCFVGESVEAASRTRRNQREQQ